MNIREALKDHVFDVDGEEFQVALSPRAQNAVLTLCILSAVMVAVGSILPSFEIEVTGLVGIAENFYHGSGSNVKVYVVLLFERISHTLNAHTHTLEHQQVLHVDNRVCGVRTGTILPSSS